MNWPFIRILLPRKYGRKTVHLGTLHQICLKLLEIIQQPEGRRLEFKESIPRPAELAKTVVAFANDAGGDLYVGVRDEPRMVSGIPEDQLLQVEEQISNIIYDYCTPVIVPEISFHGYEDAWIIRVRIVRGSNFPYFLKSKGKSEETYIRVGSSNRPADEEIIADIKVAIYDDMVEITSPGKLLPSIDFHDLEARQSDIRNRAIAPVFKKMGIIDQWGNGLRLIAEELKKYPEIGFRWLERGLSFQVQFFKRTIDREAPLNPQEVFSDPGAKSELSRGQVGAKSDFRVEERQEPDLPSAVTVRLLQFALIPRATGELMGLLDWKSRSKFRERYIIPLLKAGLLRRTVPDKPNSSRQQYETTAQGRERINK